MYIPRNIQKVLIENSKNFPALILTGARQTGKTTSLKKLFPDHHYISLDLPSLAAQAESMPDEFFSLNPPPLLIDEVQYAPKLFLHLKRTIDERGRKNGQFILTGSQKFSLMQNVGDSLAGRCVWFELENLSVAEIMAHTKVTIETIICRGQAPELWRNPKLSSANHYHSYLATYLERDIRQILKVKDLRLFENFIRQLAFRNSQILNYSDLARDIGLSVPQVKQWLSILESSNQISILEPWHQNLGKRLVKSPKIYFNDTGLLCFLLGIEKEDLYNSPFRGGLFETITFLELKKAIISNNSFQKIYFYRDQNAMEIDFIVEKGSRLKLIEVKWTASIEERHLVPIKTLVANIEHHPTFSVIEKALICTSKNEYIISDKFKIIPVEDTAKLISS